MRRVLLLVAAFTALAHAGAVAAPVRQTVPSSVAFATPLEQQIFPLIHHLRSADGWSEALARDRDLRALAAEREARLGATQACAPQPLCRADAWLWTDADIARVARVLRRLAADDALARSLVERRMRPSGAFARHAALGDTDLLAAAWDEAARGINRLIAVYAKGEAPRYAKIDSIIFDVTSPDYAQVLAAQEAITRSERREGDLVFDPPLRYALGLLMTNERIDAVNHRPLLGGENAAALSAMQWVDWSAYPYAALLIFGHGPEDPQSRTGVMGHLRLRLAADRFRRGQAPFIIVSGGNVHPNRTPFNEAIEMRDQLVRLYGIPADRILLEPHARHTTTNLRNVSRILLGASFPTAKPALILSDPSTVRYIASDTLAERNRAELGYVPGRIGSGPDPMALTFWADPISFHVDPRDPLDP